MFGTNGVLDFGTVLVNYNGLNPGRGLEGEWE